MSENGNLTDKDPDHPLTTGVLLTNLGTPNAPTASAVREYLAEFLSDPRVIKVPRPIWWLILHGFILRSRPARSAKAYQKIWTEEGSPLLVLSTKLVRAIQETLNKQMDGSIETVLAMRYGNPSILSGLKQLKNAGIQRLLIFPLYPQYSDTTTASTFDAITEGLNILAWQPKIHKINHYYDNPLYINALAESIRTHWENEGRSDKLLFSFHGIPKQYADDGDPYPDECRTTAHLVAEQLQLVDDDWLISFQSRFGPGEWLKPYTDTTLREWGHSGIKSVSVISPGFSADCLETLEEISIQNRDFFLAAGGGKFFYIPALNDHPSHIETLKDIILEYMQTWPSTQ
ncbi:MAG: ferrochelatase [Gammaproteobacteria bacterium]